MEALERPDPATSPRSKCSAAQVLGGIAPEDADTPATIRLLARRWLGGGIRALSTVLARVNQHMWLDRLLAFARRSAPRRSFERAALDIRRAGTGRLVEHTSYHATASASRSCRPVSRNVTTPVYRAANRQLACRAPAARQHYSSQRLDQEMWLVQRSPAALRADRQDHHAGGRHPAWLSRRSLFDATAAPPAASGHCQGQAKPQAKTRRAPTVPAGGARRPAMQVSRTFSQRRRGNILDRQRHRTVQRRHPGRIRHPHRRDSGFQGQKRRHHVSEASRWALPRGPPSLELETMVPVSIHARRSAIRSQQCGHRSGRGRPPALANVNSALKRRAFVNLASSPTILSRCLQTPFFVVTNTLPAVTCSVQAMHQWCHSRSARPWGSR